MPEIGAVRFNPQCGWPSVYMQGWHGHPPVLVSGWAPAPFIAREQGEAVTSRMIAELKALPDGTIIDVQALPKIVVVKEAPPPRPAGGEPTQINDETFDALLGEAAASRIVDYEERPQE